MIWFYFTVGIALSAMTTIGEDGREYTLQVAPWESEDE